MNQIKTNKTTSIRPTTTRWNSDPIKESKNTTVLCHHNSRAGIIYEKTRYSTTTIAMITTIQSNAPLSDELFPKLIETSRFHIHAELFNRFPAEGHGDFPISVPVDRNQDFYGGRTE